MPRSPCTLDHCFPIRSCRPGLSPSWKPDKPLCVVCEVLTPLDGFIGNDKVASVRFCSLFRLPVENYFSSSWPFWACKEQFGLPITEWAISILRIKGPLSAFQLGNPSVASP